MKNILELTGVRFFAAFVVCAYHFSPGFGLDSISSTLRPAAMSAVSLFFILSGFILSYTYVNKIQTIKLSQFFWARFSRLSPAFIAVMIAMIPIRLVFLMAAPESSRAAYGLSIDSPILGFTWLANLFLVAVFIPMLNPWLYFWNPPAWSLTAEAVFYVSFPFVIILLKKIKHELSFVWTSSIIYLILCLTITGTFFVTMNMSVDVLPEWYKSSLSLGGVTQLTANEIRSYTFTYFAYLLPFFHCFEFWIGCSIGYFFLKLADKNMLPQKNMRNLLLLLSILLIYLGYQVSNLTMGAMGLGIYAVYTLGFTLFIFTLACGSTFASRLLSHKWVVTLGKSSYALYISHYAGMAFYQYLANIGISFPKFTYYLAVVICVALSLAIYYFVEVPGQRWLINFGKTSLNL